MSLHNPSQSLPNQILTAFFDSRSEADAAVARIIQAGVPRSDIALVEGAEASGEKRQKGFFEMLGYLFIPHEDRQTYAEGLRRGGYLVSVPVNADNHEQVRDILDDEGTVDLAEREHGWRQEGWAATQAPVGAREGASQGRLDRSALFERAPSPGPSGTNDIVGMSGIDSFDRTAERSGRRIEGSATTRTRSYLFDDESALDQLLGAGEGARDLSATRAVKASELQDRNQVELDDERRTEAERLRSGTRDH